MRNVFILAAAAAMAATVANADTVNPAAGAMLTGSMEVEVNSDKEATLTLGAGLSAGDLAFGSFNVESVDGGTFTLDQWQIGADVAGATLSFGDQDGVFVEGENGATLAAPVMAESLKVSLGDAQVAVGLTDWNADITDVSNVQGAYTVGAGFVSVTASGDYNLDSEEYMLGGRADGVEVANIMLGSTLTYSSADEQVAYEIDGAMMGVTAYLNGDDTDALQNVGASYGRTVSGLELGTELNYNLDSEEFTPSVTVGFSF